MIGRKIKLYMALSDDDIILDVGIFGTDALGRIGSAAAEQILAGWETVLASSDPEGPHGLRIGLRRLRTALHILKGEKLSPDLAQLETDAQELARIVGQLRDAEVLLGDIFKPAAKTLPKVARHGTLRELLISYIKQQRKKVRDSLQSPKWLAFRLNCLSFDKAVDRARGLAAARFEDPGIQPLADKALGKSWKQVHKSGRRIGKLSALERHAMRKKLKTLRYTTEFFLPLYPAKKTRAFLKKLRDLQDVFGYLNDVTLSRKLFAIAADAKTDPDELLLDAVAIYSWHMKRSETAWRDAQECWKKLKNADRFWE
ncbi:MAG: CHAD domain-containing protein [Sneathiella sp.]|nr:CHAD domain-containing protein [Sneathiella sp.]